MTTWLAGMRITADRLNDGLDPVIATTGATAPTGFTLVNFVGVRVGRVVTIEYAAAKAGTDAAPGPGVTNGDIHADINGNIADTLIGTLPADWCPADSVFGSVGDGFGDGDVSISTAGAVTVRSWSNDGADQATTIRRGLVFGRNLRVNATWIARD